MSGHIERTKWRCDSRGMVLLIQDTTELNYSGHRNKQGMGYLRGSQTQGLLLHTTLATSWDGTPLGVVDQQLWAREGRGTRMQRREIAQKESGRWIESLKRSEARLRADTEIVTIADREADIYELLSCERRAKSDYLIRTRHDRQVKTDPEAPSQSLYQLLENSATAAYIHLSLKRTPRRPARELGLIVKWVSVWLQPPEHHPQRAKLAPIQVQILSAEEDDWDREDAIL